MSSPLLRTPEEGVWLRAHYLGRGWSIRDIATEKNASYGAVYNALRFHGIKLRARGGPPGRRRVTSGTGRYPGHSRSVS
jgi:hypothetical protein